LLTQPEVYGHEGSGSGGYFEHVMVQAAKTLFNYELSHEEIVYKQLRNHDFKEATLEIDGEVKLRFALAYGFRNIQNIVQKIKKGNCPYHYVEIMACPSGKILFKGCYRISIQIWLPEIFSKKNIFSHKFFHLHL
jgi:iron only hydrogenase large subunit-like protein